MSWFGRHNTNNQPKSGELGHIHRPVIMDGNGVKHPIIGYQRHNTEHYMARTEAVVKYRRFPGMADEEYTPMEEYGTGDLSGRNNEFAPKSHDERVRGPIKNPPWGNGFRLNIPPSKDHHHTTHDDDIRDNNTKGTRPNNMKEQNYYHDDEKNTRNGFTEQGPRSNNLKDQEDYYERANPKTNAYSPPKYAGPASTHQVKDKGNDHPRARMGPFGTPPRNETSYETSNFKPIANSPPRFNPQPKIEPGNYNTQETIDTTEARRRYGKGAPGAAPAEDNKNSIDSKEAARRYNGVLLTN